MVGIALSVLAGSFTANAVGMPEHALMFQLGYTAVAFIPKGDLASSLLAVTPDLSALTADFVKYGGKLLRNQVNEMDLFGVTQYKNVSAPIAMPKLSASGNPRPYAEADATSGNGAAFTDRVLTVYQSKWDFDVDPELFRNTYLADQNTTDPFYKHIIDQVGVEYAAAINDSVLGSGIYNAAGSTAAAIANGFITIAKAEVTATNLTAKVVGAIASSDAVTKVETFAESAPVWMQKKGFIVRCSFRTFHDFKIHYRTLNGFGFQRDERGQYILDGFNKPVILLPTSWITTDGLFAHVDGALAFGTDGDRIQVAASMRRNIIETRLMMPVGCQIADLSGVMVSDTLVA